MSTFTVAALLITFAAFLSYINHRFIKLPTTIGLMASSLVISLILLVFEAPFPELGLWVNGFIEQIHFSETLMEGMLSFLLFAGALHVNLGDLLKQKWTILALATFGVVLTTAIVGTVMVWAFQWLGVSVSPIYCYIFGALIAPTDPIAVLSILKSEKISKALEIKITGESLFNDGVGIVIFLVLSGITAGNHSVDAVMISQLFAQEALGGIALGLFLGHFTHRMLSKVTDPNLVILLTLALVSGGYALAQAIHTSGPIAIVIAGLFMGNTGRTYGVSESAHMSLDLYWEVTDHILNSLLFVMIGMEVLIITVTKTYLAAGLIAVIVTLGARFAVIFGFIELFKLRRSFDRRVVKILTWGGLRGGISVALALSLPNVPEREILLTITYVVVTFSILGQGLTIKKVLPS